MKARSLFLFSQLKLCDRCQYKHTVKSGLVTVAGKLSDDLAPGTLNSIFKQAQLKEDIKNSEETSQTEEKKEEEEK